MIVESGSVTMDLDLNRLNGISSVAGKTHHTEISSPQPIRFFSVLVFNDLLRGPEPGQSRWSRGGVNAPGYSLPVR